MYISTLKINNFGPIEKQEFIFNPEKINVICGKNAVGKTQILASVYAIMFGTSVLQHHANSSLFGTTEATFYSDGSFTTIRQHHTNTKSYIVADSFSDIGRMAELKTEKLFFYFPEYRRASPKQYTHKEILESFEFLQRIGISGHHVLGTCNAKTQLNIVMNSDEQNYLDLICFLKDIPENSIVIADGILTFSDNILSWMVFETLKHMKNIQFILAESRLPKELYDSNAASIHSITSEARGLSPVSYNYKEMPANSKDLCRKSSDPLNEEIINTYSFRIGDAFYCGEGTNIEFKEIVGNNPCQSIIANAEIYTNAYLNSRSNEVGKIYWGIDDTKIIKGVKLTYNDIDNIQRRISEALSQFHPFVDPDLYRIVFHKTVSQDERPMENTYVVEIDVYPHTMDYLFSTSKDEVYIKTVGGKKKLSAYDIQIMLQNRMNKKLVL